MDDDQVTGELDSQPSPLGARDLPEGFGATGRLVPTGMRWTFVEVLRSRCLLIVLMACCVSMPLVLLVFGHGAGSIQELVGSFLDWVGSLVFMDEYELAQVAMVLIAFLSPVILLHGLLCTLVLKLAYNRRERRVVPIPRAREVHAHDARFRWNVLFAAVVGVLCFILLDLGVFIIYSIALTVFELVGIVPDGYGISDTTRLLLSYVALMLAELPNRRLAGSGNANALIVEGLAAGGYETWLPARLRNPEGRALVNDVSEVLGGLLDAFATIITFGAFGLVVGAAEEATEACAENATRGIGHHVSRRLDHARRAGRHAPRHAPHHLDRAARGGAAPRGRCVGAARLRALGRGAPT